jgi:hypothetical protein
MYISLLFIGKIVIFCGGHRAFITSTFLNVFHENIKYENILAFVANAKKMISKDAKLPLQQNE